MALNNRDLAALILLGAVLIGVLWSRRSRESLPGILKSLTEPKILLPALGLVAWVGGLVRVGEEVRLWEPALVAATVAWVLVPGVVLLYKLGTRKSEEHFFRPLARRTLRLTWFVEAFVAVLLGLYVFGIVVELILLIVLFVLGTLSAVAASEERLRPVKQGIDSVLGWIGIGLLVYAAIRVVTGWHELDKALFGRALLLPFALTFGVMPYLSLVGLWAGYDTASIWVNAETDDRATRRRAKLGLVLALHLRGSQATAFRFHWAREIAQARSIAEARRIGREFLRSQESRVDEARKAAERLRRYAGVDGQNEEGQRLDQREFAETKKALQWLATMQMGWYRNRGGRYRAEVLNMLEPNGLPEQNGIDLHVSPDGQSWWAWRRTVTGWCFAIGATGKPPDQWLYDGPEPPSGFPGNDGTWGEQWGLEARNW